MWPENILRCGMEVAAREEMGFLNPLTVYVFYEGTSVCARMLIFNSTSCPHPWTGNVRLSQGPGRSARHSGFNAALPSAPERNHPRECSILHSTGEQLVCLIAANDAPGKGSSECDLRHPVFVRCPSSLTHFSLVSVITAFFCCILGSLFVPFSESCSYS